MAIVDIESDWKVMSPWDRKTDGASSQEIMPNKQTRLANTHQQQLTGKPQHYLLQQQRQQPGQQQPRKDQYHTRDSG
jgi:hypothetical protein